MKRFFAALVWMVPAAWAFGSEGVALDHVKINLTDKAALQRGAKTFVDYCLSCHSASLMRYARTARDLGITEAAMNKDFIFAATKIGDPMTVAMQPKDAVSWLGVAPPDLSTIARYRGTDWLYSYLRGFYSDPSRPTGANNRVFKDVAMPNVLWELQGVQEYTHGEQGGKLILVQPGRLSPEDYDRTVADLVNYLAYMGEPSKIQRNSVAPWVIGYLLILLVVLYLLKKEYWKDVR